MGWRRIHHLLSAAFVLGAAGLAAGCVVVAVPGPGPAYVANVPLNVRAGPSDRAPVVTAVPPGAPVYPDGRYDGGWWEVRTPGGLGWVYSRYLSGPVWVP